VNTTAFCYLVNSTLVPLDVACRQSVGNLPKCLRLIISPFEADWF